MAYPADLNASAARAAEAFRALHATSTPVDEVVAEESGVLEDRLPSGDARLFVRTRRRHASGRTTVVDVTKGTGAPYTPLGRVSVPAVTVRP